MKLIILDRDGVINHEDPTIKINTPAKFIPIAGSLNAIAKLKQAGYIVTIATNQAIIANNFASVQELSAVHDHLQQQLTTRYGVKIDKICYCPHSSVDNCCCRKPKPGMLLALAQSYKVAQQADVPFVGDSNTDVFAAIAAGMIPVLVRTGKGSTTILDPRLKDLTKLLIFNDLAEFVDYWIAFGRVVNQS